MADLSYPDHLISSNSGGLTEASYIAYEIEERTDSDGDTQKVMTKSVAQKIQEIEQGGIQGNIAAENVQYGNSSNVKSALDTLNSIALDSATIINYKNDTRDYKNQALQAVNQIEHGYFVDELENLKALYNNGTYKSLDGNTIVTPLEVEGSIIYHLGNIEVFFRKGLDEFDQLSNLVSNLNDIAYLLASSFDNESLIIICDSNHYNTLVNNQELQLNTLYFCYLPELS